MFDFPTLSHIYKFENGTYSSNTSYHLVYRKWPPWDQLYLASQMKIQNIHHNWNNNTCVCHLTWEPIGNSSCLHETVEPFKTKLGWNGSIRWWPTKIVSSNLTILTWWLQKPNLFQYSSQLEIKIKIFLFEISEPTWTKHLEWLVKLPLDMVLLLTTWPIENTHMI